MKVQISLGVIVVLIVLSLIGLFCSWVTVDAGHRGVLLSWGAVQPVVFNEGLNMKMPFRDSVVEIEVRTQKEQIETEGASKDLQTVKTEAALNFHPVPEKVGLLYQQIGTDYLNRIIAPTMQESIKAILALYTAEELITKRELVRESIKHLLAEKLLTHNLIVEELNIVDFDFSSSFNQSIEAKVTAEQNALAAKNKLAQIEFEAQQKIAEAKGKAEAMSIESAAIATNPQILTLRALEKWNGDLPKVTGGAIPLIDFAALNKTTNP